MPSAELQQSFKPNEIIPETFRFIIYPIDPAPMYVIKNHRLNFDSELTPLKHRLIPSQRDQIYQDTYNYFDVRAMFANTYREIKTYFRRRKLDAQTNNMLVVDIPKAYFPQIPDQVDTYKSPAPDFRNHKIFINNAEINEGLYRITHSYDYEPQLPGYPVYQQTVTNSIGCYHNAYFFDDIINTDSKDFVDQDALKKHNALLKRMAIQKYDNNDSYHSKGMDLLFASNAPIRTVAYRRESHGMSDWCTTQRYFVNKSSYLNLTGGLNDANNGGDIRHNIKLQANATKIAQLFLDYAGLRPGISAFFHFNLFRHSKNIIAAKEIANELLKPESQTMSNLQIAQLLKEKYAALQSDHYKVWQLGSFNRRMSYAIMQLTDGICQTMDEFNHAKVQDSLNNFSSSMDDANPKVTDDKCNHISVTVFKK